MLPPQVRVIQGDGIDKDSLPEILNAIMSAGWSTDNVAFGSGGGLLQKINRDTCKFAFKCCSITVNGEQRDVYKQPIGSEWKMSKKGKLKLIRVDGKLTTVSQSRPEPITRWATDTSLMGTQLSTLPRNSLYESYKDELVEVYRDGEILVEYSFDQVRANSSL
jgi:nicotinamide phosphoribosyltransferase